MKSDGRGYIASNGKGNWSVLRVGGNNGLLLHVMALAWWGNASLGSETAMKKWTLAVKEVSWALEHIHKSHKK
jgi:hypothetical protein